MRKRASQKAGADKLAARGHGSVNPTIINPAIGTSVSKTPGIVLLGFMGAGKSSVGRCLAELVGWAFEDLDERIETRERRKVHEIFRDSGEAEFRRAERVALQELLSEVRAGARKVLALGGGAFVQKENAKLIEDAGLSTVFLDTHVDELWRRCREQAERESVERPLVRSLSSFRELYESRRPHYRQASFRLTTDGKTVDEIAEQLAKVVGLSFTNPKRPNPGRRKRGEKN